MFRIYPIVEGHGEVRAFPLLARRIAGEICGRFDVEVLHPHRVPRGRMLADNSESLQRAVELGTRKIEQTRSEGTIVVLLDADDDCPAELAPRLLGRITRPDVATGVILAKREFEAWFLAGARSLRTHAAVADDAVPPEDPEGVRDAKGYLEHRLFLPGRSYSESVDQPSLSAMLSLEEARAAPSFDKLCRELTQLISSAPAGL